MRQERTKEYQGICECGYDKLLVWKWEDDEVETLGPCLYPTDSRKTWRVYCPQCGTIGQPGIDDKEAIANWNRVIEIIRNHNRRQSNDR